MSIRRAVEGHLKLVLDKTYPSQTYPHPVVESLRLVERPNPAIIIVAGSATSALPEQPDTYGNWRVPITITVMSPFDDFTVDQQSELAHQIGRIVQSPAARHRSTIQGLYVYDITPSNVGIDNDGRRMISVLNFEALVNYIPEAPIQ